MPERFLKERGSYSGISGNKREHGGHVRANHSGAFGYAAQTDISFRKPDIKREKLRKRIRGHNSTCRLNDGVTLQA